MEAQEHGLGSHDVKVFDTMADWRLKMSDRAPAYQGPSLGFYALRLVALREGGRTEETPATENERKCLYAHLRTYTQPTQIFAAGARLQPTPSPLCGLA